MSSESSSAPPSRAGSVASKAEKHFNTARTPKHCNRAGGKRGDDRGVQANSGGSVDRGEGTTATPPSPPRRHRVHVRHPSRELERPPSPPYDRYYDYGYHAARPPVRGFYDYYEPHYDRYDYRGAPRETRWNYHDEDRHHVAPRHADPHATFAHRRAASGDQTLPREHRERQASSDSHAGNHEYRPAHSDTNAEHNTESANNSLRAVSSSFSANESLNQESLPSVDGGDHGTDNAQGLASKHSPGVVTAVDSMQTSEKPGIPHPPSLSSKTTSSPTNNHHASSSPQSDSSWRQLRQIASIDTKDPLLLESQSEELSVKRVKKEEVVVLPSPKNKSSPNEGHGLEKSISRTSSLSNSPTEEEFTDKFPEDQDHRDLASAPSEEHYRYPYDAPPPYPPHPQDGKVPYYYARHLPRGPHSKHPTLPPLSMHFSHQTPPFDENSPSTSTISTKDTRSFFPPTGIMKPKHPVHLKSGREMDRDESDNKRRKTSFEKKEEDDISPANASDFGDIGAIPSWDKNLSGWSVCSGMTGMESLINKDLNGTGVLSAFSFGSEMSKKEKKEEDGHVEGDSPDKSVKGKRKHGHLQFSQSFEQPHSHAHALPRKRMHDGRTMPPPGRYRRLPHEEYPYPADVPPHLPQPHPYEYSPPPHPARYPPRYPPREYHDDEYYYDYGSYPPRYYDYRGYRPPPHSYPYRPPHEYDYHPQPPRVGLPPLHGALARPPVIPPPIHTAGPRVPIAGGWSKEDDLGLMDIMKKHKNVKNWEPIAKKLNRGKSAKECQDRWIRFLKPGSRKGQWTESEDRIVFEAVSNSIEDPFTRWSDLAQQLPGRVGKQVRDRWVNHLNPAINHLPFSKEDDLRLWEGHNALGKRWVEISAKYFNSTRSENHIKNRWYSASFKKFICGEFGPDAYRIGNEKGGISDVSLSHEDQEQVDNAESSSSANLTEDRSEDD